jgi:hypothetical protein
VILEATFSVLRVAVEVKAMPIPIPRIKMPPIIAMVAKLKIEGLEAGTLSLESLSLASLGSVNRDLLRFIVA